MSDRIPDTVLEAMAGNSAGAYFNLIKALKAAEAMGYKLTSREPIEAMAKNAYLASVWRAMHDAAPGVE